MNGIIKKIRRIHGLYALIKGKYINPYSKNKYGMCGKSVMLETPIFYTNQKNVFLGEGVKIRQGFQLINDTGKFVMKKYSAIALNCVVVTGNHKPTVGIPHVLLGGSHINDSEQDVVIEEDVWVGVNCTLISGCHLGRGSIVGACSMVNREVPPYAVVVGSPAKVIASVFSLEQIIEHERLIYSEHERYSRDYLTQLFDTHYKDKKSIGTSEFSKEDAEKLSYTINRMNVDFENSAELIHENAK